MQNEGQHNHKRHDMSVTALLDQGCSSFLAGIRCRRSCMGGYRSRFITRRASASCSGAAAASGAA